MVPGIVRVRDITIQYQYGRIKIGIQEDDRVIKSYISVLFPNCQRYLLHGLFILIHTM